MTTTSRTRYVRLMTALPLSLAYLALACLGTFHGFAALSEAAFPVPYSWDNEAVMEGRPDAPGSLAGMLDSGDCWTGADKAPAHPTRVYTDRGLQGPRVTRKALEQVFNGVDHGITVRAFCR